MDKQRGQQYHKKPSTNQQSLASFPAARKRQRPKKSKKVSIWVKLVLAMGLLLAMFLALEKNFAPIIEAEALQQVHNAALSEMAAAVARQIEQHSTAGNYHTLMNIERDDMGKISMISADMALINSLVNDIILDLDSSLTGLQTQQLSVPLFAASGSKIIAALGPKIPITIEGIATPNVKISDDFVSTGINQVKHSIYLQVETDFQVVVPFNAEKCTVSTQVLLAEGIIVGDIPDTVIQFDSSWMR